MYVISRYLLLVMLKRVPGYTIKRARERREMLKGRMAHAYAVQTENKFLAFFEKQAFITKAIVGSVVVEYFRLKSSFRSLARKIIEALIINGAVRSLY